MTSMTSSPIPSNGPEVRQRALAIISAWALGTDTLPEGILPDSIPDLIELSLDLGLVAAAFLHCWAGATEIPIPTLLSDIALGQALDQFTREAVEE
jgi:hypothetical protein